MILFFTYPITSTMPLIREKRGPELDCLTRAKICELHLTNGWGASMIKKKRFPDIPRSTIQYTLTQESKRQNQGAYLAQVSLGSLVRLKETGSGRFARIIHLF
jgi:hypothetical protein